MTLRTCDLPGQRWWVYHLETDGDEEEKIELYYDNEDDARRDARTVTQVSFRTTAIISRVLLKRPEAWTFDDALALLKRSGYAKEMFVVATYTKGKEVPNE